MMDEQFQDHLALFLDEQLEGILYPMQKTDKRYMDLAKELKTAGEAFENVLNVLSKKYQDAIEGYIPAMYSTQAYENRTFYLHGYKDCVNLLFFLAFWVVLNNLYGENFLCHEKNLDMIDDYMFFACMQDMLTKTP